MTETCVICSDDFGKDEDVMTFPCKHVYHTICGTRWLIEKSKEYKGKLTCPLCRKEMILEEVPPPLQRQNAIFSYTYMDNLRPEEPLELNLVPPIQVMREESEIAFIIPEFIDNTCCLKEVYVCMECLTRTPCVVCGAICSILKMCCDCVCNGNLYYQSLQENCKTCDSEMCNTFCVKCKSHYNFSWREYKLCGCHDCYEINRVYPITYNRTWWDLFCCENY